MATNEGLLFESINNESKLVLDLKNDNRIEDSYRSGIYGVASNNELVYVSYLTEDIDGLISLVVD